MYFLEFITGSFIGILVVMCLALLFILSAMGKDKKPTLSESAEAVPEVGTISYFITRQEIIEDIRKLGNPDITIAEYSYQPQLPTTLKDKGRTYTMLYGTDKGVLMIVRIADDYADELAYKYPGVRRASFPHAPHWYCVPVEGAFTEKEEVFRIVSEARAFLDRKSEKNLTE